MPEAGPWRMPPEWAPHERTWMAWPSAGYTLGDTEEAADTARATWAAVARAVAAFEPVVLVADPGSAHVARSWTGGGPPTTHPLDVVEHPLDDAWMRDTGPTFVVDDDGHLGAVDWVFNGWGAQEWASWDHDAAVATEVARRAGATRIGSALVNEGGGIHVDGHGTVLLTETVQLDPGRNPGLTHGDVEDELARTIGATRCVWLPRGLTRDYDEFGTRGHVDIVATFAAPGTVLLHWQGDAAHPDHEVSVELERLLASTRDARGERLEVVRVPAPRTLEDGEGWVDWSSTAGWWRARSRTTRTRRRSRCSGAPTRGGGWWASTPAPSSTAAAASTASPSSSPPWCRPARALRRSRCCDHDAYCGVAGGRGGNSRYGRQCPVRTAPPDGRRLTSGDARTRVAGRRRPRARRRRRRRGRARRRAGRRPRRWRAPGRRPGHPG